MSAEYQSFGVIESSTQISEDDIRDQEMCPERAICGKAIRIKQKVQWKPEKLARNVDHVPMKATGSKTPDRGYVGCSQQGHSGRAAQVLQSSHLPPTTYPRFWTWNYRI